MSAVKNALDQINGRLDIEKQQQQQQQFEVTLKLNSKTRNRNCSKETSERKKE